MDSISSGSQGLEKPEGGWRLRLPLRTSLWRIVEVWAGMIPAKVRERIREVEP
jgi:hypothetical protein